MAINPFDFVNDINYKKKDILSNDFDNQLEGQYKAFLVNRSLSFNFDTILQANEMNTRTHLDNKLQYHYLLNIIRPKNRFGRWLKAEKYEAIDLIVEYYGYSLQKAREVVDIFSDEDLNTLRQELFTGGLKENNERRDRFSR
jgi:hypothetical protein|tara:strand:+ start:468 stop:893 length:426 start_codon:yes stop_codon:yes gene_type:complete